MQTLRDSLRKANYGDRFGINVSGVQKNEVTGLIDRIVSEYGKISVIFSPGSLGNEYCLSGDLVAEVVPRDFTAFGIDFQQGVESRGGWAGYPQRIG